MMPKIPFPTCPKAGFRIQARLALQIAAAGLLIFGISDSGWSRQDAKASNLTLNQCIEKALRENLDLSIELLNPDMDALSLREAREKFLPDFSLYYQNNELNQPPSWGIEGSVSHSTSDYLNLVVSKRFSLGTVLNLNLNSQKTDTTRAFMLVNPSYYSNIRLDLTQPLLRGFGPKIGNYEVVKAERSRAISDANLMSLALQTVYQVEEAYWNLVLARESLQVVEMSLANSREMLTRAREAARIGTGSGKDVLNAEAETAFYEDSLLSANRSVQAMEDRLKKLMNLPTGGSGPIVPLDRPTAEVRDVSADEVLHTAMENRSELAVYRQRLENGALDVAYFRNQSLPQFDLKLSLWNPGQSGIKNIYQDNNPLSGVIIDRIVGGRMDSFSDIFKGKYKNWQVSVNLSVPLANLLSRTALARARLARDQIQLQFEKQRQTVEFEVEDIVRDLSVKAQKIVSSARSRELKEKQVASEYQRYQQGLVGSEFLFTYQKQLSDAKTAEIRAVVDYRIALARLDVVRGTSSRLGGAKFRD